MKKIIALTLSLVMLLSLAVSAATFTDVAEDYWAVKYISEMQEKAVVNGYPEGDFRPENPVTRAEFAKMLAVISEAEIADVTEASFADVAVDEWYAPYVAAAKDFIPSGELFDPETDATREDVATAIVKALKKDGADVKALEEKFSDYTEISEEKATYVAAAVVDGIIEGYPEGTFMPKATITRAEICAMLSRAFAKETNDDKPASGNAGSGTSGNTTVPDEPVDPETAFYKYSVSTDKTEYSAGEMVYLTVTLNTTAYVAASQLRVNYDPAFFDIEEENDNYTNEEWLVDYYNIHSPSRPGTLILSANPKGGKIAALHLRSDGSPIDPENAIEDMIIFKMQFKVKENVTGDTRIFVDDVLCVDDTILDTTDKTSAVVNDVTVTIK